MPAAIHGGSWTILNKNGLFGTKVDNLTRQNGLFGGVPTSGTDIALSMAKTLKYVRLQKASSTTAKQHAKQLLLQLMQTTQIV